MVEARCVEFLRTRSDREIEHASELLGDREKRLVRSLLHVIVDPQNRQRI
jgi:hypothetical protein